jgi:hypothetical protein
VWFDVQSSETGGDHPNATSPPSVISAMTFSDAPSISTAVAQATPETMVTQFHATGERPPLASPMAIRPAAAAVTRSA